MIYLCVQITKIQIMKIELVVSFYMFKLTNFGANAWKICKIDYLTVINRTHCILAYFEFLLLKMQV